MSPQPTSSRVLDLEEGTHDDDYQIKRDSIVRATNLYKYAASRFVNQSDLTDTQKGATGKQSETSLVRTNQYYQEMATENGLL